VYTVCASGGLDYAPTDSPLLDPIAMLQTFYASAERIALARGRDPDRPQFLSKVTKTQ
jgi:glutamine---fructose-6-phosphate transaminase (isomerizing)